jgi:hypothetical protein
LRTDATSIVSGILATQDEAAQLQISTTVLRSTAIAGKIAAEKEQASPANPGPGVGDNLDVTA